MSWYRFGQRYRALGMHNSCRSIPSNQILSFNHNRNQESSPPQEASDIREAMQKVLTAILPHGILPALRQRVLRASELGLFENHYCFGCQPQYVQDFLHRLFDTHCFDILSEILPICMGQNFFQNLCTGVIESTLLGMVWVILNWRYAFAYDVWKVINHTHPAMLICRILASKPCQSWFRSH